MYYVFGICCIDFVSGSSPERGGEKIRRTELLPTELRRESEDDKQDKRCYRKVLFCDADTGEVYTDLMELHILELKKLPPEDQNEAGIIRWMRFLSGKSRKEFDHLEVQKLIEE